ncbi:MAG: cytochrome c biogenesis protein DipZ [Solimonas sp.]
MTLFLLAYFGGVLTILSPCILPVLPFVFARAGQPFARSGLPLLAGMALMFAGVATLAAVGGGWAVHANEYGRYAALALLALFGLGLLFPGLADRLARPLVAAGARLSATAGGDGQRPPSVFGSFVLGVATGLLWAPCAGPILGLLLTGAALQGANSHTALLLLAYGLGAATSLAAALLVGGRLLAALKRSLGIGEWIRRGLGVAVLAGVAAIALGLDTGLLTRLSLASTASLEQGVLDRLHPRAAQAVSGDSGEADVVMSDDGAGMAMSAQSQAMNSQAMNSQAMQPQAMTSQAMGGAMMAMQPAGQARDALPVEGTLPSLDGAVQWLNSPPLTAEGLRGKVVLVDFWTYSCINCLRALPYVRAWADKYRDQGLVVIGVHAPEFAFEKNIDNVRRAIKDLKIDYPVAVDNNYAIWRAFNNQYWPAHYFIDAQGRVRHHHFGEGQYDESEAVIRQLLKEAGQKVAIGAPVSADAGGVMQAADDAQLQSPETYVGYARAERFASPGEQARDAVRLYTVPGSLLLNQWGLAGNWLVHDEKAALQKAPGRIAYRFHARDLHLVLGPGSDGKPIRFRVTLDGRAPGAQHGVDTDADGKGTIAGQRLYQLIRQSGDIGDRTFEIEFLDPGAEAFAFTFG